jgi:cytoskeletal protein RodZ
MSDTDKTSSYGLYLQTMRVEKGISVEDVAAETRIRTEILRAIEAEDHSRLPDDVFVKGFLRAFARAIGAEPQEALNRFDARRGIQKLVVSAQPSKPVTKAPSGLTLLWVAAVMVCLVGGTLFAYQAIYERQQVSGAEHPTALSDEGRDDASTGAGDRSSPVPESQALESEASATPSTPVADTPSTGYRLEIRSHEKTWLKVIADDERATEHTLNPGDSLTFEADTTFNLLIGNAGGVTVQLNDQPVAVPGNTGQVVNLQLP